MIDQSTVITSARFQSRRPRIWVSRSGAVVASAGTRTPKRSTVGWEAYVVDTATQQAVEGYPRQKGTDVIELDDQHSNPETVFEALCYGARSGLRPAER